MRPTIQQLRALTDFSPSYRWDMNAVFLQFEFKNYFNDNS